MENQDKKLVALFLKYLDGRIRSGALDEGQKESVEVAVQCLESVFAVSSIDAPSSSEDINQLTPLLRRTTVGSAVSEDDKNNAESLKNEGNQLMKENKYQEALDKYSDAIKLHASPVFYCNRAAAYSKMNDFRSALDDCKQAIDLDPTYSKAFGRMGLAYSGLDDHEKARDSYKKALELDPDNQSFKNNLEISEAKIRELETAAEANPFAGLGGAGGFPGMPNIGDILNNPQMMNMATQMMSDPNVQNFMQSMMSSMTGGGAPGGGTEGNAMQGFLETGQRLAQQMQEQNPDLVQRLQEQTRNLRDQPGDEKNDEEKKDPAS